MAFAITYIFFLFQWLCIPFLMLSPAVADLSQSTQLNQTNSNSWMGKVELADAGIWADEFLLMVRFLNRFLCESGDLFTKAARPITSL